MQHGVFQRLNNVPCGGEQRLRVPAVLNAAAVAVLGYKTWNLHRGKGDVAEQCE